MLPIRAEPSQLVVALDKTIEVLTEDFRGDSTFSFATEADMQSTLLGRLRANVLFYIRVANVKKEPVLP